MKLGEFGELHDRILELEMEIVHLQHRLINQ
jgi:hypothetical protein